MTTFRTQLEAPETFMKSGAIVGLGAENHWNFRFKFLKQDCHGAVKW
jgi:hypothetical protein